MDEAKLFETLGRKQAALDVLDANYTALLNVLAGVVGGQVDPHQVLVNLTDRSWVVAPRGERPAQPGTVNGLPVVVVAPEGSRLTDEDFERIRQEVIAASDATEDK